jgi:hypothetical protein
MAIDGATGRPSNALVVADRDLDLQATEDVKARVRCLDAIKQSKDLIYVQS